MVSRSSEQTSMAGLPSASTLPWIWVVEALASSNHVDASLLIDLVKRIPEMTDDHGRSAKEMFSFRILQNLSIQKKWNMDDSSLAAGRKIRLDPSERCEDVLNKILQEISASDMKMSGAQMLKWDIQSFVAYKRSTLPQCFLLQLKDMIVKGSDPHLATLKDRSGLSTTNQSGNAISVDGSDFNGIGEICEERNSKHLADNGNLVASTQDNGNNRKEILHDRDLLPAKKRKCISADYQGRESHDERTLLDDDSRPYAKVTKNCKQIPGFNKDCEHITECIEKEGCNLENESQSRGLEESGPPLRQINDNIHQHQCSNSEIYQGTDAGRGVENICIDAAREDSTNAELRNSYDAKQLLVQQTSYANETERNFQHSLSNDGPTNEPEPCSGSDEYHEARIEIASKKTAFLSSQCTYSQDSHPTTDLRELNLCMKCNRGGRLLVCSSETCPLVVHDSCLGSIPSCEKDGRFYCPFCAYSRAISEYMEVKKKASLARKDLASFIGVGIEQPPRNFPTRSSRSKTSQSRQDEELCEKAEANNSRNSLNDANSPQSRANTEEKQQEQKSASSAGHRPPSRDKRISLTNATPIVLAKDPQESQGGQDSLSLKGDDQRHNESLAITIHPMHDLSHGDPESSNKEPCSEVQVEKENGLQRVSSLHHQPELTTGTDVEESSDEEKGKSLASKYCIRFHKPENQYFFQL